MTLLDARSYVDPLGTVWLTCLIYEMAMLSTNFARPCRLKGKPIKQFPVGGHMTGFLTWYYFGKRIKILGWSKSSKRLLQIFFYSTNPYYYTNVIYILKALFSMYLVNIKKVWKKIFWHYFFKWIKLLYWEPMRTMSLTKVFRPLKPQILDRKALKATVGANPYLTTRELMSMTFDFCKATIINRLKDIRKVNKRGRRIAHDLSILKQKNLWIQY